MTARPKPPAHVAPYVKALGEATAVRFLLRFGGSEVYVAATPKGRSMVAREFGIEVAEQLARIADQLPARVPTAKPYIARMLKADGLPVAEIARTLHIADKTVRGYLSESPSGTRAPDPRQPSLF